MYLKLTWLEDFNCPYCNKGLELDYPDDYTDPPVGTHENLKCPECEGLIKLTIWTKYNVEKQNV
jgi:uncharacterized Zn-finger protein